MYNNFIDKYSDLKRAYVNLIKDSKRIYDENDIMERKYNEMCGLYDEISLKLAKAIIQRKMYALRNQFKIYEWMEVRRMKEFSNIISN